MATERIRPYFESISRSLTHNCFQNGPFPKTDSLISVRDAKSAANAEISIAYFFLYHFSLLLPFPNLVNFYTFLHRILLLFYIIFHFTPSHFIVTSLSLKRLHLSYGGHVTSGSVGTFGIPWYGTGHIPQYYTGGRGLPPGICGTLVARLVFFGGVPATAHPRVRLFPRSVTSCGRKVAVVILLRLVFRLLITCCVVCVFRDGDNDNGKQYKYVCITTNQPGIKANPNPNHTAHNSERSTKYGHMSYIFRQIHTRHCCCIVFTFFPLSLSLRRVFFDGYATNSDIFVGWSEPLWVNFFAPPVCGGHRFHFCSRSRIPSAIFFLGLKKCILAIF